MKLKIKEYSSLLEIGAAAKKLHVRVCEGPRGYWGVVHTEDHALLSNTYLGNSQARMEVLLDDYIKRIYKKASLVQVQESAYSVWDDFIQNWQEGLIERLEMQICLIGTPFQRSVWKALIQIPYGKSVAYSEVCKRAKVNGSAYRAVGTAIGKNPLAIVIPCHRVIRKDGGIGGFSWGLPLKKQLINIELENCKQPLI